MSLGENSLVAAYQGKGKRTVDHQRTRVVTISYLQYSSNLSTLLHSPITHRPTARVYSLSIIYVSIFRPPFSSSLNFYITLHYITLHYITVQYKAIRKTIQCRIILHA